VKDGEVKPGSLDSIKAELSDDISAMFRAYFEAILVSPSNQWLLKSMEMNCRQNTDKATNGITSDMLAQDFEFDGDMEDLDDCPSTMTYESSGIFIESGANVMSLTQEAYSKLWHEFVNALWNSTDSLWLMPCSSEEKPHPVTDAAPGMVAEPTERTWTVPNDHWLSPASQEYRQKIVTEIAERAMLARMENFGLSDVRHGSDFEKWLLHSKDKDPRRSNVSDDGGKSAHGSAFDKVSTEEWLGWKALLEKQRNLGDHSWLYHPPAGEERDSGKGDTITMDY